MSDSQRARAVERLSGSARTTAAILGVDPGDLEAILHGTGQLPGSIQSVALVDEPVTVSTPVNGWPYGEFIGAEVALPAGVYAGALVAHISGDMTNDSGQNQYSVYMELPANTDIDDPAPSPPWALDLGQVPFSAAPFDLEAGSTSLEVWRAGEDVTIRLLAAASRIADSAVVDPSVPLVVQSARLSYFAL